MKEFRFPLRWKSSQTSATESMMSVVKPSIQAKFAALLRLHYILSYGKFWYGRRWWTEKVTTIITKTDNSRWSALVERAQKCVAVAFNASAHVPTVVCNPCIANSHGPVDCVVVKPKLAKDGITFAAGNTSACQKIRYGKIVFTGFFVVPS